MNTEIDPFPVSELMNRYSLGKQAVYNRIDALKIKTVKQGNRSYISLNDLQSLDALHNHIQSGGTMADFVQSARTEAAISPVDKFISPLDEPDDTALSPANNTDGFVQLVREIAAALRPETDPLQHLAWLERAAASDWELTTSDVQKVIGVKPHCKQGERSFRRGSFTFHKVTEKDEQGNLRIKRIGSQTAWRVVKAIQSVD